MNQAIAALSTASGNGAIAVIRISGSGILEMINGIFIGKNLTEAKGNTIIYGKIKDSKEIIDEVLVAVFRAPNSFTGEDVIEINCHGGAYVTAKILKLILSLDIRLADKGEFTKRAFLNGKMDILKAEGINDIIQADSEKALRLANNQLFGKTSKMIEEFYEKILMLYTRINVSIDYPEYDDDYLVTNEIVLPQLIKLIEETDKIIKNGEKGLLIKNGIKILILGKPNVGKSSLLNALIKADKAIVTSIAGTTRDIVEGTYFLNGQKIILLDTAGIHETKDEIEKIGIEKTFSHLEEADLILAVFDNSKEFSKEDEDILKLTEKRKRIILLNKCDLTEKPIISEEALLISTFNEKTIKRLEEKILEILEFKEDNLCYLSNVFHLALMDKIYQLLKNAEELIFNKANLELVAFCLNEVLKNLKEITGENYNLDFLERMFANFCLGK